MAPASFTFIDRKKTMLKHRNFLVLVLLLLLFSTLPGLCETGSFQVSANSSGGTSFTNRNSYPIKITFYASGQWTCNPQIGYHGPDGQPAYPSASGNYALPNNPEGGLILHDVINQVYYWVGSQREFEMNPGETVFFLMNDDLFNRGAGFRDNKGTINVNWSY
jgi:hypothetical protein